MIAMLFTRDRFVPTSILELFLVKREQNVENRLEHFREEKFS